MKRVKSNMGKAHDKKAMMRLADGGIVDPGYPRQTPEQIAATAGFPMSGQAPVPYAESNQPLPAAPVAPVTNDFRQSLRMNGNQGAKTGFDPGALLSKPKPQTDIIGVRAKDGGHISLKGAIRHGEVHGPGGPRDDKVPAMLSDGEYVIPADVVDRVGKENLDALVSQHHEGGPSLRDGQHFAAGGLATTYPQVDAIQRPPELGNYSSTLREPVMATSPEARAHVEATRGPMDAPPAPRSAVEHAAVQAQPKGALYRAGRFAGGAARVAGGAAPLIAGAPLAGFGDYQIDDPGVDSSAGATLRNAYNRARDMVRGTAMTEDREAGQRGLQKGAVEVGLDAASGAAKTVDFGAGVFGAHPDLAGSLRRNVEGDLGSFVKPQAQPVAAPGQQVTPNVQTGGIPSEPTLNEPPVDPLDEESRRAYDANQRAIQARFNEARSRAQDPRYQQAQADNDARIDNARANTDAEMASLRGGMTGPAAGTFSAHFADRNARRVAAQYADIGQRERESLRQAGTAVRGQNMTAATARNAARIEQMNKDRQFSLDNDKFNVEKAKTFGTDGTGTGGEVGRAEQKARDDAVKNTHERITTMIPPVPDKDGKMVPDAQRAQRYTAGLNAVLGDKVAKTEAYLKTNPGDAQAKAWLAKAKSQGVGALDEADVRRHVVGMQAAEQAQESHSPFNPIGGTGVVDDAPVTSLKRKPGFIFDDYVTNRGDVIPARHIDKKGGFLGVGGQRDTNYDILKEPSLRK